MGSSRSLLITSFVVALATPVFAQGPLPAADLEKQGLDLYKAGNYAAAVDPLKRAYEMEPNRFDYRLAYAQALGKAGQCGEANPHFKALLDSAPDPTAKQNVQTSMAACSDTSAPKPAPTPPRPPPPPAPAPTHETSASGGGSIGGGTAFMAAGAGAGIAAGVSLFFAARWSDADADAARSYDDYVRISNRADRLYIGAAVAGGVGLTLGVISIVRIRHAKERNTDIAVTPRGDGGAVVVRGTW